MKTVAIIQARMGSSRLPGKVLMQICGRSILEHVVLRVRACREVDEIVVATTKTSADAEIVLACQRYGVSFFRGSEEDVLARYHEAAQQFKADIVVRITADCPLVDPMILEQMLKRFKSLLQQSKPAAYMSNTMKRTFPRGLDVEVFTFACLQAAHVRAHQPFEREHVTPFMYQHPEQFVLESFTSDEDFSRYRWTVDTEDDLDLIRKIYEALYQDGKIFTTEKTLELLEKSPDLARINSHIEQKET